MADKLIMVNQLSISQSTRSHFGCPILSLDFAVIPKPTVNDQAAPMIPLLCHLAMCGSVLVLTSHSEALLPAISVL